MFKGPDGWQGIIQQVLMHKSWKILAPPNLGNAGTLVGTKANIRHAK